MSSALKHVRKAIRELEAAGIDADKQMTRGIGPENDLIGALQRLKRAEKKLQEEAA